MIRKFLTPIPGQGLILLVRKGPGLERGNDCLCVLKGRALVQAALRACERVIGAMTALDGKVVRQNSQDVRHVVCRTTNGRRIIARVLFDWKD